MHSLRCNSILFCCQIKKAILLLSLSFPLPESLHHYPLFPGTLSTNNLTLNPEQSSASFRYSLEMNLNGFLDGSNWTRFFAALEESIARSAVFECEKVTIPFWNLGLLLCDCMRNARLRNSSRVNALNMDEEYGWCCEWPFRSRKKKRSRTESITFGRRISKGFPGNHRLTSHYECIENRWNEKVKLFHFLAAISSASCIRHHAPSSLPE